MRIVIATGIYPPEVGGPAYYAQGLAEALRAKGHDVPVVTYGALKKLPSGIRHFAYLLRLVPQLWRADAVIALDTFSVALPAALACSLFRVPFIIRTGGDFLWEAYIERTHDDLPFPFFYERHRLFTRKERVIFSLTKWVLHRGTIVFNTELQRGVWREAYSMDGVATCVIDNAIARMLSPLPPERRNFLWYARGIWIKNGDRLHEAFALAQKRVPGIVLEEGQLPQQELVEKMRRCYAVILSSLSELGPNYILDALRCGKPFIQTKYSGYAERFKEFGLTVDPLSVEDIADKIVELCDPARYAQLSRAIAAHPFTRSYEDVADDFLAVIKEVCAS